MGKKLRGAALRARKRAREAQEELEEKAAEKVEVRHVQEQPDDALFVLDTSAQAPSKKTAAKKEVKKRNQKPSAKEEAQIKRLVERHTPEELKQLAAENARTAKRARIQGKNKPTFDIWGEDTTKDDVVTPRTQAAPAGLKPEKHASVKDLKAWKPTEKSVALEVAQGGQSYNPDKQEHQKTIQEAVDVELRRQEAEKIKKAPIAAGMSAETRALLVGDSSDEESDDESTSTPALEVEGTSNQKREKLTRAQRNKQKRLRQEEAEIKNRKAEAKKQNAVGEAKTIAKQLRKSESERAKEKAKLESLKQSKQRVKGAGVYTNISKENPLGAPTVPVALSSDIKKVVSGGGLRSLKPKGSLLTDRMVSLTDRGLSIKKTLKKRKRVEGKRRKIKVRGKEYHSSKGAALLG